MRSPRTPAAFRGLATPYTRENVVVGAGAKPIIWNLLSALLDPGDQLVYADPAYPAYASAASYLGAKAIPVHLLESRNWRLDLDELAAKVGPKTKALVINSPHNPTGGVLTRDDLETIARLAQRHDFLVIADEIYSRNVYGPMFESITALDGMRERTIVIDGFSKAYAMTGWRLGYCIAPEEIAKTVTLFNNNTFSCVATFVQRAGIAALTGDDGPVQEMNAIFRERRDAIVGGLNAIPACRARLPEGAFYAFPNVSQITCDDRHLAKWLLENAGVACLGGSSFGAAGKGYLRFSYAASLDDIGVGARAIARGAAALRSVTARQRPGHRRSRMLAHMNEPTLADLYTLLLTVRDGNHVRFDAIDRRFDLSIDARFEAVDARFEAIDARFDLIDRRFEAVDVRFGELHALVVTVKEACEYQSGRIDGLEVRMGRVESELAALRDEVRGARGRRGTNRER